MKAQLSRERLKHIRASYEASKQGHAFIGHPSYDEQIAIIDALLAGMDSVPVAWVMADDLKDKAIISTPAYPSLDDAKDMTIGEIVPLYAASPAPVAVKLPTTRLWAGSIECYEKSEVIAAIKDAGMEVSND